VMTMSVCLSVCLFASISTALHVRSSPNFRPIVHGCPKSCTKFKSMQPFKIILNGIYQNVPRVSENKDYVYVTYMLNIRSKN